MTSEHDVVLTMGVFDGVHLGHRHLAQQVMRRAQELHCLSGIITLHPHPQAVLRPGNGPPYLVTLDERLALLRDLGLDLVARLPFTLELARLSALEFMGLLRQHLRLRELWVGPDFALGHRREGTVTCLAEIGQELAYQVHAVSPLVLNGQTVSSTLIRHLVRQGQVEAAARLLKRRHHVSGTVVPDDQRGHYLGSPTAQVVAADGLALPAGGVYAAYAQLGARQWPTLAYVGLSLAGTERRLEVHMPDLAGDLDGQSLRVEFVRRLPSDAPLYLSRILDCANGEGPGPGASPEPCLSQPPKHSPVSRAWIRFEAAEGSTRPRLQGKADRISACRSYVSERGAWETWSSIRGTERAPGS